MTVTGIRKISPNTPRKSRAEAQPKPSGFDMAHLLTGDSSSRSSSTSVKATDKPPPPTRLALAVCPQNELGFLLDQPKGESMPNFHNLEAQSITGELTRFSQFEGQLCLVVNVASN